MAYAKYTFFEAATQHGYISALMSGRVARSREFAQIIIDPARGRVYQAFKVSRPEAPFFEYVIPERETTESVRMWEAKVKKGVEDAWKKYERAKAQARSTTTESAPSGGPTSESSSLPDSNPSASLTDAPLKSESLSGESGTGEPAQPASGPEPSTPVSSKTGPRSSKTSGPRSQKSGSKSRSSSGESTANSG